MSWKTDLLSLLWPAYLAAMEHIIQSSIKHKLWVIWMILSPASLKVLNKSFLCTEQTITRWRHGVSKCVPGDFVVATGPWRRPRRDLHAGTAAEAMIFQESKNLLPQNYIICIFILCPHVFVHVHLAWGAFWGPWNLLLSLCAYMEIGHHALWQYSAWYHSIKVWNVVC